MMKTKYHVQMSQTMIQINQRRRLRLGEGDANVIHKLFSTLQKKDPRFFHLMDIDEDLRLRNVMWIHPRSIAAYHDFHDVVSFDTTYLINQYQMPLATVVGVNHHNHSILLGCELLTHEHADSFKWFFSNWVEAMGGVHPTAILTDQCESIKIVVREVLPNTIHRLCLWHICQKVPQKFKNVVDYKKCSKDFYSMIYNSLSIAQFEERWIEFLSQYGLQSSRWLKDLYAERENWAPIYLKHFFWAGMVSTQRNESMHAFFDSYVNCRSTLKMFVEQYEIAVNDKASQCMHFYMSFFTLTSIFLSSPKMSSKAPLRSKSITPQSKLRRKLALEWTSSLDLLFKSEREKTKQTKAEVEDFFNRLFHVLKFDEIKNLLLVNYPLEKLYAIFCNLKEKVDEMTPRGSGESTSNGSIEIINLD